jgi:hypothetical protein
MSDLNDQFDEALDEWKELQAARRERDRLRSENEQLKKDLEFAYFESRECLGCKIKLTMECNELKTKLEKAKKVVHRVASILEAEPQMPIDQPLADNLRNLLKELGE